MPRKELVDKLSICVSLVILITSTGLLLVACTRAHGPEASGSVLPVAIDGNRASIGAGVRCCIESQV